MITGKHRELNSKKRVRSKNNKNTLKSFIYLNDD